MSVASWSVRNRVAVNLFTITLLIAGIFAATTRLKLDLFPDVSTNLITITTLDPTTSIPEDIERTITVPIEEELSNVEGITKIHSVSQDNFSNIIIEIDSSVENLDPILNEVRQAVDKAKGDLPLSAEDPLVQEFDMPFPLINFTVAYPPGFDLRTVRPVLDRIERRLKLVQGVSDVLVDGLQDREVWVEVDPFRADSVGVSMAEIVQAVSRKNLNAVAGRLDAEGGQRVVRILGEIKSADELNTLPIKEIDGRVVRLRDIATVKETTEEAERLGRVNLRPAVTFSIVRKGGSDALESVAAVRKVFDEEVKKLPPELETQAVADGTKYIKTRIETVLKNGFQALTMVTFLLILLLNWRLALVVAFGLPVSFAGTFLVLYFTGHSINLLSLFAMIMALGMVVDDAVVISENVFRFYEAGYTRVQAAIKGTMEVLWPVLGSVSTTVAAFLPLIWGDGIIGKFLAVVPVVVISALAFSLLQAFFVLPSHLADFLKRRRPRRGHGEVVSDLPVEPEKKGCLVRPFTWLSHQIGETYDETRVVVDRGLRGVIEVYLYLLKVALRWRYISIGMFAAMLISMVVAGALGVIRFQLFAVDFADIALVKLELPADYSLKQTEDAVAAVEQRIVEVLPEEDLIAVLSRVGAQLEASNQFLQYGTNLAMITVDINEQSKECRMPSLIEKDLRGILEEFPEFVTATAKKDEQGPPVGRAVNVEIHGPDFAVMAEIANKIETKLADIDGVVNIGNDFPRGKTEFRVIVDEEKAARAALDVALISETLQAGFRGIEAAKLRWGNDEVVIRVKMDERYAHNPEILRGYRVKNRNGKLVDLSSVAAVHRSPGIARIIRLNQERQLTVSADIDTRAVTSVEANKNISKWAPEILADYPGYTVNLTGESEDTEKSLAAMKFAAVIAMLLIYALLATITNSFALPIVIMIVIPFAIIGVMLGLIFMGEPLGLMSIMGTIALAGIVVNNSVVFVDFMNRYRHSHTKWEDDEDNENIREQPFVLTPYLRWRSIMLSAKTRFRPIFLTTSTTVVGLTGLAFTTSGQEQFLAPMAQAVVWGLSFASLVTMVLIPCCYAVLDDLKAGVRRLRS